MTGFAGKLPRGLTAKMMPLYERIHGELKGEYYPVVWGALVAIVADVIASGPNTDTTKLEAFVSDVQGIMRMADATTINEGW